MRQVAPALVVSLLGAAAVRADGLADLRACLATLAARDPIRATVTVEVRPLPDPKAAKDAAKPEPVRITVEASAGDGAVTVTAPPELLAALRKEGEERREGKRTGSPLRSALDDARVDALASILDAGGALAERLAGATAVRESADSFRGAAARLLVLKPVSELDEEARKHVKNLKEELLVWVGADGCPLATERTSEGKFRFMVISAEFRMRSHREYARLGDRLVVTREEAEANGEGMGEQSRDAVTVTVVPHPPDRAAAPHPASQIPVGSPAGGPG